MSDDLNPLPRVLAQRWRDDRHRRDSTGDILLDNRIIFMGFMGGTSFSDGHGSLPIADVSATMVIQQLLYLQHLNAKQDIHFYINSPGGSVSSTLAIYDTMQFLDCDVATYCMGMCASGAAILLAAGKTGKRYALPHSKVMIHQPWGQIGGQASDVEIEMNEVIKIKKSLNQILSTHTGRTLEEIERETERNRYFSAAEAKEFGLVDDVLEKIRAK